MPVGGFWRGSTNRGASGVSPKDAILSRGRLFPCLFLFQQQKVMSPKITSEVTPADTATPASWPLLRTMVGWAAFDDVVVGMGADDGAVENIVEKVLGLSGSGIVCAVGFTEGADPEAVIKPLVGIDTQSELTMLDEDGEDVEVGIGNVW